MLLMLKTLTALAGIFWLWQAAACLAAPAVLASLEADIDGNGQEETIELYGDKLNEQSRYYRNLLVLVRGQDGKMQTAYTPDLQGGYGFLLEKIPQKSGETNVVVSAAQGRDGSSVAFRILDFKNRKQVRERFTGSDNLGLTAVAAYLPQHRYKVTYEIAGQTREQVQEINNGEDSLRVYDEQGSLLKAYLRPQVSNLRSLTAYQDQLFTRQDILDADGTTVLGQVELVWSQKDQVWTPIQAVLKNTDGDSTQELVRSRVNINAGSDNWQLYSRGYWLKGLEINYPVVAVNEKPEVQNAVNQVLSNWLKGSHVEDERAYRVEFAGPNLLSLILFREGKDGKIKKEIVNFDMRTGRRLSVKDVFRVEDKDFLRVLSLVGMPQQEIETIPENWYFNGRVFTFIVPRDEEPVVTKAEPDSRGETGQALENKKAKVIKATSKAKAVKVVKAAPEPQAGKVVKAAPAAKAVKVPQAGSASQGPAKMNGSGLQVKTQPAAQTVQAAPGKSSATAEPKPAVKGKSPADTREMLVSAMDLYNFVRDKALPASK